jgi:hypothetical protein
VGEGEIYVTTNFVCFEPSKHDHDRVKLAIVKMNAVTKVTQYALLWIYYIDFNDFNSNCDARLGDF